MSEHQDDIPECYACHYKTDKLNKVETSNLSIYKGETIYTCDICYRTKSGNAAQYPSQYADKDAMNMLAFCTNLILDEIRKQKE